MTEDQHNAADDENGDDEREIPGAAITLDGVFNPGIIHPQWFVNMGLLDADAGERAAADPALKVTSELSEFHVSQYVFRCRRDRLRVASTLGATETDFEEVRKVVCGTLEYLPHMPVHIASLNRSAHTTVDADRWKDLTERLAPRDTRDEILPNASMASMTMRLGDLGATELLEVTIQDSLRVPGGAFVSVIKRLLFHVDQRDRPGLEAMKAIEAHWSSLQEQASEIIERIRGT